MQWILMALLTAAAALAVLMPAFRKGKTSSDASSLAIYRDQMETLESERAQGLIAQSEAEAARTEIARRMLRAQAGGPSTPGANSWAPKLAALAALLLLPLMALGLYFYLGTPNQSDLPLTARLEGAPNTADVAALIGRVEEHLKETPDDGQGWELIAPIYAGRGRFEDAAKAYGNALRVLGPTSERHANLGEMLVRAANGAYIGEAMTQFEAAIALDPQSVRPRFFRALLLGAAGRSNEAIAAWTALLKEAPPGIAWADVARQELARLQGGAATRGPSEADIAGAANLGPEDRLAFISSMVENLAARLAKEPNDADGWTQLIRSYVVLGRGADAKQALAQAQKTFVGDQARLAALDSLAKSLNLIQ